MRDENSSPEVQNVHADSSGNNLAVPMGITTDIRGFPRFLDDLLTPDTGIGFPTVDMGAFEFARRYGRNTGPLPTAPPVSVR